MSYDNDNIFAKILRGELPAIKVYEDESTLAFMDIMPQQNGHTLVIPKEPAVMLLNLSDEAAADLIVKTKMVAKAVKEAMQAEGITIYQLNGSGAGQMVPHIHFHILPGSLRNASRHASEMEESSILEENATKIRAAISAIQ